MEDTGKMDKDDLIKSLQDLEFSQAEIDDIVSKAEKEDKFESKEPKEKPEDEKTIDEEAEDKAVAENDNDMKKSYDKIMSMKGDLDKSMTDFLNKYGNAPGIKTPDTDIEKVKAIEVDIEKSEVNSFEKAFGDKFDSIQKSLESQSTLNEEIVKSLQKMNETVNAIAEAPNPLKGIFGNYRGNLLEKGEKLDQDGRKVISLRNKDAALEEFQKAIDKVDNEQDKQIVRNLISDFNIANKTNQTGLNIVKKALNIDIEK